MRFDWDGQKSDQTKRDRGFGFDYAARIFRGRLIESEDRRHDYGEIRMRAVGEVDGLILTVVYTDRGETRRIISARPASKKERAQWHG